MESQLFPGLKRINARALCLGLRIDLRGIGQTKKLARYPLVIEAGSGGAAVLFRYGAVVLFGLSAMEEAAWLADLERFIVEPFQKIESEGVELLLASDGRDDIINNNIMVSSFSIDRLQIIADVLAKSVVLDYYEIAISEHFERIEPLAASLQKGARRNTRPGKELLAHIGDVLSVQGKMVGRVEVREKPELLWEAPELDRLYLKLVDEYEVVERHISMERKLDLIWRTSTTLLELLQTRRSLRVEWYIVILIVVEILITLSEKLFHF